MRAWYNPPIHGETRMAATDAPPKLAHLDMLRGVAILMVVMVHTAQQIPGLDGATALLAAYGQMGVQLFFVVSAYTLCLSHERRAADPAAHFYIRRFFRIAPLYYLGVVLYFGLRAATGQDEAYTAANVAANLTFTHGFVKAATNSIVPGGWSIAVEMSFYLLFPLAFAVVQWSARKSLWLAAVLVSVVLLANIAAQAWIGLIARNNAYYYSIVNQLPVFAVGMFTFFAVRQGARGAPAVCAGGFLAFTAAGLALYASGRPMAFAWLPTVAGIGFAFLLVLFHAVRPRMPWLARVGKVSFSMYVTHFAVAWFLAPKVAALLPPLAGFVVAFALAAAVTFAVSVVLERLVESTGIRAGEKVIARLRVEQARRMVV